MLKELTKKNKLGVTTCLYCGGEHEVIQVYAQRVERLEKVVDCYLVECVVSNIKYLEVQDKAVVLN